jgi:hypothetical protein
MPSEHRDDGNDARDGDHHPTPEHLRRQYPGTATQVIGGMKRKANREEDRGPPEGPIAPKLVWRPPISGTMLACAIVLTSSGQRVRACRSAA